ncbi:hypothetical protein [Mucilaginibacter sp. SG564]|uniref:hypothetical protein n=1 Tax=unclassified Mucilaginibacter TaxID=2617802 RepID=UPI001551C16A|nr:hypothetical protein [Mucilaginibacter sp. SG564]NOW95487.1 hypothetical protein [Mucilaginibacter sp. SG564]
MVYSNIQTTFKKYLLAFSLLLSFFALSGHVSQSIPGGNRVSTTELFANKSFILKGGISYKRAALAFRSNALPYFAKSSYTIQSIFTDNKLAVIRYRHLSQIFSSAKYYFTYTIDHLYRTADQRNTSRLF